MKNYLKVIIIPVLFIMNSCNDREKEIEYTQMLDSLNYTLYSRDSTINDFLFSFNEIRENLDSVAVKQNIISIDLTSQKEELKRNVKDQINFQINTINDLLEENKKKIGELNRKLSRYSIRTEQFQKMINGLNEQITQQNNELQYLNEKLNSANGQVTSLQMLVDTLSNENSHKSKMIADQTEAIQTAYYVIGRAKDLQQMNVIDKTGGLLGIGKTSKLNADLDENNFTRIDYTKVVTIPINSKKAKVITAHPSGSYSLDKENDRFTNLHITKPKEFWSASKYLVVVNN